MVLILAGVTLLVAPPTSAHELPSVPSPAYGNASGDVFPSGGQTFVPVDPANPRVPDEPPIPGIVPGNLSSLSRGEEAGSTATIAVPTPDGQVRIPVILEPPTLPNPVDPVGEENLTATVSPPMPSAGIPDPAAPGAADSAVVTDLPRLLSPAGAVGLAAGSAAAVSAGAHVSFEMRWRDYFPLASLLARLRRDRLLEHPTRRLVYAQIRETPGIRYRELLRTLGLPRGSLSFHLSQLERGGYVRSVRILGRTHFFVGESPPGPEALLLTVRQRRILEYLQSAPGASQREISAALGMSRSNVSYNIRALRALGLVEVRRSGQAARCFPCQG